ncbi:MAG: sugar phosphate nucleotidyltransferase [Candidatus Diapherotrites archaeon]
MLAIILAGGKGTRLMPLTKNTPKAMILLKGKPLLEHLLESIKKAGINEVVIVVGYKKDKIKSYFGSSYKGITIKYVEQKKQLGTAHALSKARFLIEDKKQFMVCNADVIPKAADIRRLIKAKGENVMTLRYEKNPEFFGVVTFKRNRVISIDEKPKNIKNKAYVNAGLYKFSCEIFNLLPKIKKSPRGEYELTDALKVLAKENKLNCIKAKNEMIDISSLKDLEKWEKRSFTILDKF